MPKLIITSQTLHISMMNTDCRKERDAMITQKLDTFCLSFLLQHAHAPKQIP